MTTKTLFIGLDGMEPLLVKQWAQQGKLPNLARLMEDGSATDLETPAGFGDGVFWTSLITGCNAGKHGHFFPKHLNPLNYELYDYQLDQELAREPFWYYCSAAGKHVAVIDVYTSPLVTGLNGIQVMDWMIHDRMGTPRSWPSPLIDHLHAHYMEDPLAGNSESYGRTDEEKDAFQQGMLARIKSKTSAACELLQQNQFDLFCLGFCDPHDVGHQSWNFTGNEQGAEVFEIYLALDHAVQQVIDSAQTQNLFVIAGLGMEQQSPYNTVLQLALGHFQGMHGDRKSLTDQRRLMRYFELPHNMHAGAVRINLQGRESQGLVAQEDYNKEVDQLAEKLEQFRCAERGIRLVKEVVKVKQRYHGPKLDNLPDLLVVWEKETQASVVDVGDGTCFEVIPVFKPELRSGDHSDRALLISNHNFAIKDKAATEAIAPTICRSLGVNMPDTDVPPLSPLIN